jgi:hypothetical protein
VRKQFLKFISVILFAVVVLNLFAGSALSFLMNISEKNYSPGFRDSGDAIELVKIPVHTPSSVFQKINDHEMIYHKKLYDIVRSFVMNEIQYFYCVNDFKEEKMIERISECTASHLDYYNPIQNHGQVAQKYFAIENLFFSSNTKELPETGFTFHFLTENFPEKIWFEKAYPPPEIYFS